MRPESASGNASTAAVRAAMARRPSAKSSAPAATSAASSPALCPMYSSPARPNDANSACSAQLTVKTAACRSSCGGGALASSGHSAGRSGRPTSVCHTASARSSVRATMGYPAASARAMPGYCGPWPGKRRTRGPSSRADDTNSPRRSSGTAGRPGALACTSCSARLSRSGADVAVNARRAGACGRVMASARVRSAASAKSSGEHSASMAASAVSASRPSATVAPANANSCASPRSGSLARGAPSSRGGLRSPPSGSLDCSLGAPARSSSRMAWKLEPPMPNALTPPRRGASVGAQVCRTRTTSRPAAAKSIFGLGSSQCSDGGSSPACNANTTFCSAGAPAAATR